MASVKMADAFYVPGVIRYFCYRGRRHPSRTGRDSDKVTSESPRSVIYSISTTLGFDVADMMFCENDLDYLKGDRL